MSTIVDSRIIQICMENAWKDMDAQELFFEKEKEKIWSEIKLHAMDGEYEWCATFSEPLINENKQRMCNVFKGYGYNMELGKHGGFTISWYPKEYKND